MILKLPFPPSTNSLFAGKTRRFKSKRYQVWLAEAWPAVQDQIGSERISGPWSIELRAVRPDKRRRDVDNLLKATIDLLVACGVVGDDSEMQSVFASWVPGKPEKPPVVSVHLFQHGGVKG